jgi:hypothetical protein
MEFPDEYDYNRRTVARPPEGVNRDPWKSDGPAPPRDHVVTVGDLCFVALGQIVNRWFEAVRYQPTAIVMINSPTASAALKNAVRRDWATLTPDTHRNARGVGNRESFCAKYS